MSQPKLLAEEQIQKAKLKEERRLAFEAKKASELKNKKETDVQTINKNDLKKERRERQEAQRAAKNQNLNSKTNEIKSYNEVKSTNKLIKDNTPDEEKVVKTSVLSNKPIKKGQFYSHIPKRVTNLDELTKNLGYKGDVIHPSIIKIGLRMNQNLISSPTCRCIALLTAFKCVINDYVLSPSKEMSRDFEQIFDNSAKFLDRCRPLSVGMRNVLRIIKSNFSKLNFDYTEQATKKNFLQIIDKFIHEEIECGLNGIREHGNLKINNNDVILTFGNSFLVKHIFAEAVLNKKNFRVIVVDAYPRLEGRQMVDFLISLNVEATYILINAIAYVMKEVNKVLIEAHTLLANGYIISEMGCSQIALVAKAHNVPVLICCETYKFSERVHTDSFVYNERDSLNLFFNEHQEESNLKKLFNDLNQLAEKDMPKNLEILNLHYDITPREFISLVITEMGFLPCTAVPVIIRRNISKFRLDG